ncbi:MAG: glycoside hydrolase family 99-like domain-containing protein [Flavobacteriaceae bacterium]|nr:glycoside hydrolase family 99-like domain-containing protein [Flavobacteriaceae bacterium]
MKHYKIIHFLFLLAAFFSCTEDAVVTDDDNILNYEVPFEPIISDYLVGAQYTRFVRRNNVPEEPSIGIYNGNVADPLVYEQHVNQANTAGIDFFIFQFRSANNSNLNNQDATYINDLQTASNSQNVNFALSYNFANMGLNNNRRIEDAGLVQRFIDDFKLMIPFFNQPNYMKVDGKNIVYIFNSHVLHSNDNAALYQSMRDELSAMGVELYLIGMQNQWTPTLRFDFRFVNGVDAVTHSPYAIVNQNDYDRFTYFHRIVNLAWEYHKDTWLSYNIEYIPTIAPSVNLKIINSGSPTYVIDKNEDWFRAHCNVARRAVGTNKIVLLDSFNDWNKGTQLESADTYQNEYLNILREEFKVN